MDILDTSVLKTIGHQSQFPRDAAGRLHGMVVCAWRERLGPPIMGGTAAYGERRALRRDRPTPRTIVDSLLVGQYMHGLPQSTWIWARRYNGRGETTLIGQAHTRPATGDPDIVQPIGYWEHIEAGTASRQLVQAWRVGHLIPRKGDNDTHHDMVAEARALAHVIHDGQGMKGHPQDPFIKHPQQVAQLVETTDCDPSVMAAAWLHAIDLPVRHGLKRFPARVRRLIAIMHQQAPGGHSPGAGDAADALTLRVADESEHVRNGMAFLDRRWLKRRLRCAWPILTEAETHGCPLADHLRAVLERAAAILNYPADDLTP